MFSDYDGMWGDGPFGPMGPMDSMGPMDQIDTMSPMLDTGFDQCYIQPDIAVGYDGMPINYNGPKENYLFTLDENLMLSIGFTCEELMVLKQAVELFGTVSTGKLAGPPFFIQNQMAISRIIYAYNICMGKRNIDVESPVSISKHMKKMAQLNGQHPNFSCLYIKHREFTVIPRTAVVANLPQGSFYVLNSKLYDRMEASYKVEKIAKEWVTIYSRREMVVTYKDRLNDSYEHREWGIPGILKVEEVGEAGKKNKPWKIKIHKSHCRLCNRFLIIITTRKIAEGVTEHHGGYTVVLGDGTILYVYARTTDFDSYGNPRESFPKTTNDTVVFDYGFYPSEIEPKLTLAIQSIIKQYTIVFSKRLTGETPFTMIPKYTGMESIRQPETPEDTLEEEYDTVD